MNMYRKTVKLVNGVGHYSTYVCRRSSTYGAEDPAKNVKAEELEAMVLELIKAYIALYTDARDRLKKLNRKPVVTRKRAELEKELARLNGRKDKVDGFIKNLYEDFADDVFSEDEYLEMKSGYVKEKDALDAEIKDTEAVIRTYSPSYGGGDDMEQAFSRYVGIEKLDRAVVETFIEKIICYSKTRFEVEYSFADELREFTELVEKREAEAV